MARKAAKRPRRKPNTGQVRFRKGRDKPYEAAFPLGGGKYRYDSFVTADEAHALLDKLTAERDNAVAPRNIAGGSMSLRVFLSLWLALKKPLVKIKTYRDYEYQCKLALKYLGDTVRIDSIARMDAQLMYTYYYEQGYKNVSQLRGVLIQAFNYALDEDYIKSNPFQRAQAPHVERMPRLVLTKSQRARLLDSVQGSDLEILWHLYSRLGLRRGEGIGLLWANIDWDEQTITIMQQLSAAGVEGTPKTKRSKRRFPVFDDILAMLRQLQKRQLAKAAADPDWQVTGLVFVGPHGQRLRGDYIYERWAKLRAALGLPESVTIHDLRHTALYHMEQAGIAESVRMAFAGHSSAAMARKYADHAAEDIEALRAAIRRMGS